MEWKLCPICELNFINNEQEACEVCSNKNSETRSAVGKICKKTNKPFPQTCMITNETRFIESYEGNAGTLGFQIFSEDEFIGVVAEDPKYEGRAVIRFRNSLKNKYGVWHLIQPKYSFAYIRKRILESGSLQIIVC
jgi:hypothetical protein